MGIDIVDKLLGLTKLGTEWVLWLLIGLSVLSVTVMIERALFFVKTRLDFGGFTDILTRKLLDNDVAGLKDECTKSPALETQTVLRALEYQDRGATAMDQRMAGYISAERQSLDRGLAILGTLGNNAPFIGLFGTVIGIIMAFDKLGSDPTGGAGMVMGEISEALVATAVGLLVAIPAVIAYNLFMRLVKRRLANAEAVRKIVVAHYSGQP